MHIENNNKKSMPMDSKKIIISESTIVAKAIAAAHRNYLLYPENHSLAQSSLTNVSSEISKFIDRFGSLVLHISKESLSVDSIKILETFGEEDGLISPLYRDGVSKIEFCEGIDHSEIRQFFKILKQNRVLPDEPKSDTVTDLWQAALPHIKYEAMDLLWDTEPVFSLPKTNPGIDFQAEGAQNETNFFPESEENSSREIETASHFQPERIKPVSIAELGLEGSTLSLSPNELLIIKQMVLEEESDNNSEGILNLLLYVFDETKTAEDFKIILTNLTEEFSQIYREGNLEQALRIINKVKIPTQKDGHSEIWLPQLTNDFFTKLSGPLFYELMTESIPHLNNADDQYLRLFKEICISLNPSIVIFLSEIISSIDSTASRTCLFEIIHVKISEDKSLINKMIENPDERVVDIVIKILKSMKNKNSDVLLYKLLRHPKDMIRSKTLDYFLEMPMGVLPRIFFLIDDKNIEIRKKILQYVAANRHVSAENLIFNYMKKIEFLSSEKKHLLNCYRTLGLCGSSTSIPFLKEKLFAKAWVSFVGIGDPIHRKGAAIALKELIIPEATELLKKASISKYSVVRDAYNYMKKINFPGNK